MNPWIAYILAAVTAYLLGSVPFGFVVARARGVNIREVGSGNIGATNVFRTVGKGWGIFTFACDFAKGLIGVLAIPALLALASAEADREVLKVIGAVGSICGHNWTCFLRFKGGKGVATSAGALVGIAWPAVLAGFVAWSIALVLSHYVSVASMFAATVIVLAAWIFKGNGSALIPWTLTFLGALVFYRHRTNIVRLANGTEHRMQFGKKKRKRSVGPDGE